MFRCESARIPEERESGLRCLGFAMQDADTITRHVTVQSDAGSRNADNPSQRATLRSAIQFSVVCEFVVCVCACVLSTIKEERLQCNYSRSRELMINAVEHE